MSQIDTQTVEWPKFESELLNNSRGPKSITVHTIISAVVMVMLREDEGDLKSEQAALDDRDDRVTGLFDHLLCLTTLVGRTQGKGRSSAVFTKETAALAFRT